MKPPAQRLLPVLLAAPLWCAALSSCRDAERIPVPTAPARAAQPATNIVHPIIGRWTFPIDDREGYIREFRTDGSVTVWWPDGKIAALGTFFVVDTNAVGVDYQNDDHDVVLLMETNLIRIDHVEHEGHHRKFNARRL